MADFKFTDRRGRGSGLIVGQSVAEAKEAVRRGGGRLPNEGITYTGMGDSNPLSRFAPQGDEAVLAEMRQNRRLAAIQKRGYAPGLGNADLSFATSRPRDPMFYWRQNNIPWDVTKDDELKKIRNFCNTPEAPVWMGDYSFRPIGEIQPGDEVMGWDYNIGPNGGQRKRLRRSRVLAVQRRIAPEVVRVTMESGRVIRCTPDHLWANPAYSPGHKSFADRRIRKTTGLPGNSEITWRQPEFREVQLGRELIHVIDPTPELQSEKERLTAAWLSGLYDGEGCGNQLGQSAEVNPGVCQRIKESLDLLGLPWTQRYNAVYIREAGQGYRKGAQQDLVNFLNWTEPARKVTKQNDDAILRRPGGGKDKIITIESEGPGEVVSMQTETGNYTAWGYASKNCRILYLTHPVVASCIDIFTKFPIQGMELDCKDEQLTEFYNTLFFDELDYKRYLLDVGREYWLTGEAWPLGSFNETLGVWEDDELLNPDDVEVEKSPFLKDPRYLIRLPESLRQIITNRAPRWEYELLIKMYPELQAYVSENARMPVSNMLMKQLKFTGDTFHNRGIPILMRAFRAIVQEEKLNAAMDAIADRLYTPLILVKLGASATDLGTSQPWIPTAGDLSNFEDAFDAAMAGDFRVITHHFGIDMAPVFGRENMPDMTADFDRLEDRTLMTFGLSRTMLQGANSGETYAADALNRDVVTQLLTSYQDLLRDLYRERALIVAEAQEHFDYDVRNGKRYVKMEEVLEVDPESGEATIVEQPALLVPDLKFDSMNLRDEQIERDFRERLNETGVPVSYRARLAGTGLTLEDTIEERKSEQVALAIAEQETRKETYKALRDANLPIPEDLRTDFQPRAQVPGQGVAPAAGDLPLATLGQDPMAVPALAPTPDDLAQDGEDDVMAPNPTEGTAPGSVVLMPQDQQRPPESDEQRDGMPKPANLQRYANYRPGRMSEIVSEHYVAPDNSLEVDPDGNQLLEHFQPHGKFGGPRHVGLRRHVKPYVEAEEERSA
jgi:hypothetical protein